MATLLSRPQWDNWTALIGIIYCEYKFAYVIGGVLFYWCFFSYDGAQQEFEKSHPRRRRRGKQRPQKSRDNRASRVMGGVMLLMLFLAMVATMIYFVYFGKKWWRNDMEIIPQYWPFPRRIRRSRVQSPHKWPVMRTFAIYNVDAQARLFVVGLKRHMWRHHWYDCFLFHF